MRTITTTKTVYKFDELTDNAKQKAIENLYDINIDCEWWDVIFEDAEMIGVKITGFDIGRGNDCTIELIDDAFNVASRIMREHGEQCETYKEAKQFIDQWNELVSKYSDGINTDNVAEDNEYDFDNEADELEERFKDCLSGCYLKYLREQYEYATSEEAIIETIEANDYEFDENGKLA